MPERRTWYYILGASLGLAAAGTAYYLLNGPDDEDDEEEQPQQVHEQEPSAPSHQKQAASATSGASGGSALGSSGTPRNESSVTAGTTPSGSQGYGYGDDDDAESVPEDAFAAVPKSHLIQMLDDLIDRSSGIMQQIQQEVQDRGLSYEDGAMHAAQRLQELDNEVSQRFGVSQENLQYAQSVYSNDRKVKQRLATLQNSITQSISSNAPEPTMSLQDVCQKIHDNADVTMDLLKELKNDIINQGKSGEEARQEFQNRFFNEMESLQSRAMEKLGISSDEFQKNLTYYMNEPQVMQAIQQSQEQMSQHQESLLQDW
eukprot:gb/GECG01011389.1/.p1 GENE.gb/GECG01011389.1/~~gb/GECG01011389.1/.p1  ORF type:complete len:316 (+),score=69.07 gb/GECG01011389.1/:1-948(+)